MSAGNASAGLNNAEQVNSPSTAPARTAPNYPGPRRSSPPQVSPSPATAWPMLLTVFAGALLLAGCSGFHPFSGSGSSPSGPVPLSAMPVIGPASGAYPSAQTVTISDSTTGATIYYTADGTTPTSSSPRYAGPITINSNATVKAISVASGYAPSGVASASYTITSPAGGYPVMQPVTLTDATPGAVIYYTTDGSTPTTSSTRYTGPVTVSSSETLKAIAVAPGDTNSAVATVTYTIVTPGLAQSAPSPAFSRAAGTYTSAQTVALTAATPGAVIYYTTDGSMPTANSTRYTAPINVSATETIHAVAMAPGYPNSAIAVATYTIGGAVSSNSAPGSPR